MTQQTAPNAQELSSVVDLIRSMVKTAKALKMYQPDHPVLANFNAEFHGKLARHLSAFGELRLDIEPFLLKYGGAAVYEHRDPRESLAFKLRSDGIRAIFFLPGAEQAELSDFLSVIALDQTGSQHDDIVTRLWEMSLPHIDWLLEEDFTDLDLEDEEKPRPSQQEAISAMLATVAECYHPPPLMVPKHLLMLSREESEWLRRAREAEAERDPVDDVINIIFAILGGTEDHALFREFVEITANLSTGLIVAGEVRSALRLVRYLRQLSRLGSLTAEQRQLLLDALGRVLSENAVRSLQDALDEGEPFTRDELREFLLVLGLPALGPICELLGSVKKLKMRKIIVESLVELGKDDPHVFAGFLTDGRWFLVRNMVLILSLLQTPVALEMITGLISHREMRVRKEVLAYLESSQDPKARTYLVKFLRDESAQLRIRALQVLVRDRHPFTLKAAVGLATAADFPAREPAEKKAICEAIGILGSESELPVFREMILKKSWFKKGVEKETAACAIAGLVKMKSLPALELLEEARRQKVPEIKGLVEDAIAAINAADPGLVPRRLKWRFKAQTE